MNQENKSKSFAFDTICHKLKNDLFILQVRSQRSQLPIHKKSKVKSSRIYDLKTYGTMRPCAEMIQALNDSFCSILKHDNDESVVTVPAVISVLWKFKSLCLKCFIEGLNRSSWKVWTKLWIAERNVRKSFRQNHHAYEDQHLYRIIWLQVAFPNLYLLYYTWSIYQLLSIFLYCPLTTEISILNFIYFLLDCSSTIWKSFHFTLLCHIPPSFFELNYTINLQNCTFNPRRKQI